MPNYEKYTVRELRELIWSQNLIPKRWMLNYVKKAEAVAILTQFQSYEDIPNQYIETIKKRSSLHRKKVYNSRKYRQAKFGAELTKDERLRLVINSADKLLFKEKRELSEGFTSYLGSSRGKTAFVFNDIQGAEYLFTKSEVQKLASMGLYVPRGAMNSSPANIKQPSGRKLRDIFSDA